MHLLVLPNLDENFLIRILKSIFFLYELGQKTSSALEDGKHFSGNTHFTCVCLDRNDGGLPHETRSKISVWRAYPRLGIDFVLHFYSADL